MYVPRPWVLFVGFVCAGLIGLGAYFVPVFQAAKPTQITRNLSMDSNSAPAWVG